LNRPPAELRDRLLADLAGFPEGVVIGQGESPLKNSVLEADAGLVEGGYPKKIE
jgi:hypothetical protein